MSTITYYQLHKDGQQNGPYDHQQVLGLIQQGSYGPQDLGWTEGMAEWQALDQIFPEEFSQWAAELAPPPIPAQSRASHPPQQQKGLAIASMTLGILSFCLLGPFSAVPAIICGHMARNRAKRSPLQYGGSGMALAGLILGYIALAFTVVYIFLVSAIAIPNFVKARETAQKSHCIANLRQIDGAKQQWAIDSKKNGSDTPGKTDLYGTTLYLKVEPGCPLSGAYTIGTVNDNPICSLSATDGHSL
ncbi:MAG: hypothetical protein ACI9TH_004018 [Kiritimatiellia bacterium]|jgi:hypothetical protein